ncbi:MAG: polysaccharide pyruvyl transferase family protein [Desulfurococcaceae archaeon]
MKKNSCNRRKLNILIAEYIPSLNKGELEILYGMTRIFSSLGPYTVYLFSLLPPFDRKHYPPEVNLIDVVSELRLFNPLYIKSKLDSLRNLTMIVLQYIYFIFLYTLKRDKILKNIKKDIWRAYVNADIIIMCHDQVPVVFGFLLHFTPILNVLVSKVLGKPLIILSNGTHYVDLSYSSFLYRTITKILLPFILNNVSLIMVRDYETYILFRNAVKGKRKIFVTADPAFLLTSKPEGFVLPLSGPKYMIGVALSKEAIIRSSAVKDGGKKPFIEYLNIFAKTFDYLIENLDAMIVFIPHSIEPYLDRDDRRIALEIYKRIRRKDRVKLLLEDLPLRDVRSIISSLDLLITTRVHAAISALSMGVPTIVLKWSSDRRAQNLFGVYFKQRDWIIDISDINFDKFKEIILDILSRKDEMRKNIMEIFQDIHKKASLNSKILKIFYSRYIDDWKTQKDNQ